jgi:hypothetical protein
MSWGWDQWRGLLFGAVVWAALIAFGAWLGAVRATPAGPLMWEGYVLSVVISLFGALTTGSLLDGPFPGRPFWVRLASFVLGGVMLRAVFIGVALAAGVSTPLPGGPVVGGLLLLLLGTAFPTGETWREFTLIMSWAFVMPALAIVLVDYWHRTRVSAAG